MKNNYISGSPFKPNLSVRKDFRDWIKKEFPSLSKYGARKKSEPLIGIRLDEIKEAADYVLQLTLKFSDHNIVKYYEPDILALNKAYENRDAAAFTIALEGFISSIDLE